MQRAVPGSTASLAIIGGGIFGLVAAIEAASLGIRIAVFDRGTEVLQGASKLNNAVVHMGYHYPRSLETVLQSKRGRLRFESRFPGCVRAQFAKYYCIAAARSLTTAKEYLRFCEDTDLPYRLEFPPASFVDRDKIDLSIRVPEAVYDYRHLRDHLLAEIGPAKNVTLMRQHLVVGAASANGGRKRLQVSHNGASHWEEFDFVLNATYSNTNAVTAMFEGEPFDLQYELTEVPVVTIPWREEPVGATVMDGPFCALNPFGLTSDYTITHVESSILRRSTDRIPTFDCQKTPLNDCRVEGGEVMFGECNVCPARPPSDVAEVIRRGKEFFPVLGGARHLRSYFVMRSVLAKRDFDDARPTLVRAIAPGVWAIFGGKIDTCLDAAEAFRGLLAAHVA